MGSRIETIFQPRFQKTCDSPKAPTRWQSCQNVSYQSKRFPSTSCGLRRGLAVD